MPTYVVMLLFRFGIQSFDMHFCPYSVLDLYKISLYPDSIQSDLKILTIGDK